MYELLWWWMLGLLPLPWLVRRWWSPAHKEGGVALLVPFLDEFSSGSASSYYRRWLSRLIILLAALGWLALVVASARPVWVGEAMALPVSGRDLMLAVDLSGSMQEQDFQVNNQLVDRLYATKVVAGDFIAKRAGDRIGLILFGDQAYLQAPLTFDRKTVRTLLNESAIGLAGERTAIGDAIGLSLKRLQDRPENQRILILMTDGANTAGTVSPLEAAEMAAAAGLKIYTVGIGSDGNQVLNRFGYNLINQNAQLDERLLTDIAAKTGGLYFRARDTAEFQRIYAELDRLEPVEQDAESWRPQQELFRWPLLLAVILLVITYLLRQGAEDE